MTRLIVNVRYLWAAASSICIGYLLIVVGGLTLWAVASPAWSQCALEPNCALVWADEFDGGAVDTNKWEFQTGTGCPGLCGWGNNELQYYRPENATVANGVLTITAKDENFGGRNYTSARLRTLGKGDWTYGRFEMRAKLPVGQGMWPAFWMLSSVPDYGTWAASGEIDIMESLGDDPENILGTIHYGAPSPGNVFSGSSTRLPAGTAQDFHVYAVEWQEGQIRWYVDGQLYGTKTEWFSTAAPYPAPFDVNFHLLLNLAVGGNLPGSPDATTMFPQEYIIDYVRVYDLPDQPPPPTELVFADMDYGNHPLQNGWFAFNGSVGGGGIDANYSDLPPTNAGFASLQTGWGSGGNPGFYGGFGRNNAIDITGMTDFSFWINPDAGQDYYLEINLQDDDNGDGVITNSADDEFQYICNVSPTGPCAISGGGWQLITVPLADFVVDNSFVFGGNDILDTQSVADGGNGELLTMVVAVFGNTGSDATFRTDYWVFEDLSEPDTDGDGFVDAADNCPAVANDQTDTDGDLVGNACDNCITFENFDQLDTNGDFFGNRCDADLDDLGFVNFGDLALFKSEFGTADPDADLDGSGFVNFADLAIFKQLFGLPPGPSGTAP